MSSFLRSLSLTILSKLLTFVVSTLTLRKISVSVFGEASVKYELLLSTCLFLGREPFRLACVGRQANGNTPFFSVPMVFLISLAVVAFVGYTHVIALYCASCVIEVSVEPQIIDMMRRLDVSAKATGEVVATTAKSISLFFLLSAEIFQDQIYCFAISQVVYSTVFAMFVFWRCPSSPSFADISKFDPFTLRLAMSFGVQSLLKNLLTEGDKLVLTFLSSNYNSGIYAMAFSYGSLVSRLILQPLEENARLLFGSKATKKVRTEMFQTLMKLVVYIGTVFASFGRSYSYIVLKILAGSKYDNVEGRAALGAMCVYQLFLALNGMSEAFLYATLKNATEISKTSAILAVTNVVYATLSILLVRMWDFGVVGLIASNCVAMALRFAFATRMSGMGGVAFLPDGKVAAVVFVFVGVDLGIGGGERVGIVKHLAVGILFFGAFAACALLREKEFGRKLKMLLMRRTNKKE